MNKNIRGNKKLFWKEVGKAKDGKVKNYNRIKDETYFVENLHNVDSGMQISVRVCVLLMELEKIKDLDSEKWNP